MMLPLVLTAVLAQGLPVQSVQHAPVRTSPAGRVARTPAAEPAVASVPLSDAQVRSRVEAYLGAIDTRIPESVWTALGAQATPVLKEIFEDRNQLSFRRGRALAALGVVGAPEAGGLALRAAEDNGEPYLVRLAALRTAERVLSPGAFHTASVSLLRGAGDVRVRARAAAALSRDSGNCEAVQGQLSRERPDDREYFHEASRKCP